MKESIEIRNAGPVRHVKIDHIKPLMVLIGESGSGKSVVMKTLMLMRYLYKMMNIRAALKNSGIKSPFRFHIKTLLHDDLVNYFGPGRLGEVVYTVDNKYTLKISRGRLETKGAVNIDSSDLHFLKESWVTDMRSTIPMLMDRRANFGDMGFYFRETAMDFVRATEVVNEVSLPYLKMKMEIKKSGNQRKAFLLPDDNAYSPIELKMASSGMQSSAPLMVLAEYFSKKFSFKEAISRSIINYLYSQDNLKQFRPDLELAEMPRIVHMHIEEPELSLYPQAQCLLLEQLVEAMNSASTDRRLEYVIATHSPYIINYLNVLMSLLADSPGRVSSDKLSVYRIYDGELQNLLMQTESGNRIVNTRDLTETMTDILHKYQELNRR